MSHVARQIAALQGLIGSPSASCISCPAEAIATNKLGYMSSRSVTGVVLLKAAETCVTQQYPRLWFFMSGWFGASGSGLAYDDCEESSSQGTVICCCSDVVLLMLSKTLAWYQYCNLA